MWFSSGWGTCILLVYIFKAYWSYLRICTCCLYYLNACFMCCLPSMIIILVIDCFLSSGGWCMMSSFYCRLGGKSSLSSPASSDNYNFFLKVGAVFFFALFCFPVVLVVSACSTCILLTLTTTSVYGLSILFYDAKSMSCYLMSGLSLTAFDTFIIE